MVARAHPLVRIVTPGTRQANNGNWRTAKRWSQMLRSRFRVILQTGWDGEAADALIALHAVRSASAIAGFAAGFPDRPIAVVLTGTDLYRDLPDSEPGRQSLTLARRIVVLQGEARDLLDAPARRKSVVIHQSARRLPAKAKPDDRLACIVVGHLRDEKDPETLFRAIAKLPPDAPIQILHIGAVLDQKLGRAARALAGRDARYRFSGAAPHHLARAAIQRAHLLVHPSRLEGGANVIVEALMAGTPVLASRMPGNVGMLGSRYAGYFGVGDADDLAGSLVRAAGERRFLEGLRRACERRSALFEPHEEERALVQLVRGMLA